MELAEGFDWPFGTKTVLTKSTNIGLKQHILECGDLVFDYDAIILLEEDLLISPYFYDYAKKAIEFYWDEESVAGISLYSYGRRETDNLPFHPVLDGYDVYFMQMASSWGQVWTKKHWLGFKSWLTKWDCDQFSDDKVPPNVNSWPSTSWKKHYIRYLVRQDKYFVFPHMGLSTNPGDDGENHGGVYGLYLTPLLLGRREWAFKPVDDVGFIYYDAFYKINNADALFDDCYSDLLEFSEDKNLNGASYFFFLNPFRSSFYMKLAAMGFLNDAYKLFRRIMRFVK
jgi:hypothetical protein